MATHLAFPGLAPRSILNRTQMAHESAIQSDAVPAETSAGSMSYEEFLNSPEDNHHVEWANGRMILRRGDDGIYRLVPLAEDGIYRSQALPDLWLRVEWLWEPMPPPI